MTYRRLMSGTFSALELKAGEKVGLELHPQARLAAAVDSPEVSQNRPGAYLLPAWF